MALEYSNTRKSKALIEDKSLHLLSPVFGSYEEIPEEYTFMGDNINPPLMIENVPVWARSLILVLEDLDAPNRYVNWFVTEIDPMLYYIDAGTTPGRVLYNSAREKTYHGPTPIQGRHHYQFTLYAVDTFLRLDENTSLSDLQEILSEHIYDKAELIGTVCCGKIRSIE